MELSKAIQPVTALETQSEEFIQWARETRQPIVITQNGRAAAILHDIESYDRTQKALRLLQLLAAGNRQLQAGQGLTLKEAERRIQDVLDAIGEE
ncbi:MAG: type II toxin-antitoxin system prevent-host-death family antitoxin [Planctomycetota bacterium]